MADRPIPLRLNLQIPEEKRLRDAYDSQPRARRGDFLRRILMLGLAQIEANPHAIPTSGLLTGRPPLPSEQHSQSSVAASTPAPQPLATPRAAPAVAAGSAKALKGFFDDPTS